VSCQSLLQGVRAGTAVAATVMVTPAPRTAPRRTGGTTTPSGEAVKVGGLAPLSGLFSRTGEGVKQSIELAVTDVNDDGGINGQDVEVMVEDTEADAQTGARAAQRLINQEDVDFLVGNNSSSVGLAVTDVAAEAGVPYQAGISTTSGVREDCNRYMFTSNPSPSMFSAAGLPWLQETKGTSSIYGITSDYSAGHASWNGEVAMAEELGIEVLDDTRPPFGETDYSDHITRAMDSGADTLLLNMWGQDLGQCVTQLAQFGAESAFDAIWAAWYSRPGGEAVAGTALPFSGLAPYYWDIDTEENRAFVQSYRDEYDEYPTTSWGAIFYGPTYQTLQVIDEAGSTDGDDIVDALEGREYTEFHGGSQTFRACDHQVTVDTFAVEPKSEGEREFEGDVVSVVERFDGDEFVHECSEACSL